MTERIVDYSFSRPDLHALKACGYTGVVRYLAFDNPATASKLLRADEVAAIHAAGLTIRLNWESGGDDVLGGAAAGKLAGAEAARQANALGAPSSLPIYYSVDFDATAAQFPIIADYLTAARVASGRPVGVYGSAALIEAMVGRGAASLGWQAQSTGWAGSSAWDNLKGKWTPRTSPQAHLLQRVGTLQPGAAQFGDQIDENDVVHDDHAAWAPRDTRPIPEEDDDMQIAVRASSSAGVTKKVTKGNVFLIPAGVYVNGQGALAAYARVGLVATDAHGKAVVHPMTGDAIRAFL